jgi:hypothetical protein
MEECVKRLAHAALRHVKKIARCTDTGPRCDKALTAGRGPRGGDKLVTVTA